MNKTTLIAQIAEKSGLTRKQAEAALTAMTDTITEALKAGDKVQLMGFGTFEIMQVGASSCEAAHFSCGFSADLP